MVSGSMSGAGRPRRPAISPAKWRGQERDVLRPVAQRRHQDLEDVQPVVEVGAEAARP